MLFPAETPRARPADAAARAVAQQQAVAGLGALALAGATLDELYAAAGKAICDLLDVEFCRVLELTPAGDALLLRAAWGWRVGEVGRTVYPLAGESQAAYVLAHSEPVVVEHWPDETRFAPPPLLAEHGVLSSIIAPLHGRAGVNGYLGIHTRARRAFTAGDVSFVQSVANLLGQAVGRAQAEEAARLSEERFRLALRTAPVALFSQDRDLRITWLHNADPAVVAAHGNLMGQSERVLYADEAEWETSAAFKRRVMETRQAARALMSATFLGRRRVFDVTAEPTFDAEGRVNGVVSASMDITELKEAQERLEESEARFRMALRVTPITVFSQDRDLNVTWAFNPTPEAAEAFGDVVGKNERVFYQDEAEYAVIAAFKRRVFETGIAAQGEFASTIGGRKRWFNVMAEPIFGESGEVTGLSEVSVDITALKETQARLEESERRVRLALGTAPVAVFGQDRDLRILWMVNADPRVVAAYGELAGLPERVLYADEREYAASAAFKRRVMETRQPGRQEMTVTFVGIRRVYAVTAEPTFDADGEVTGVVCASMDITELKDTQARLEESEARFRAALHNSPITVFQQDRDLRYTWVHNPLAEGGQSPEAIVGRTDAEVLPDKQEAARLEAFKRRVIESGRAQRGEFTLTFDRPHIFDVTAEPLRDERGEVIGLTAAAFDLTELREARAALAESEELRRLALEAADLGTLAYDLKTGKLFSDARCREIFGVGAGAHFSLERAFSLIHPDDLERAQATYARVTAPDGHAAFTEELRIVRPDGALRWINVRGRAHYVEGPERRVEQLVGIVVDVTERKRAEEALREWSAALERSVAERTAELQQRNEELDRFAYVASHDLKSPLRGIRLLAQWVQEDAHGALPQAAREHLEKLVGRVDRMERLLDDLLLYSRAGRTRERAEEIDFAAFVRDVVDTLEAPAGFTVAVTEDSAARIEAERVPLELALRHLIGNAVKHHHHPEQGRAWVGVEDAGDHYVFTVRDDGPGIDPAFHARIFDMFQTLRPRDQVEGSGMGLALVRKLAESRGGRVEVDSAATAGAEFRMWWPKQGIGNRG